MSHYCGAGDVMSMVRMRSSCLKLEPRRGDDDAADDGVTSPAESTLTAIGETRSTLTATECAGADECTGVDAIVIVGARLTATAASPASLLAGGAAWTAGAAIAAALTGCATEALAAGAAAPRSQSASRFHTSTAIMHTTTSAVMAPASPNAVCREISTVPAQTSAH